MAFCRLFCLHIVWVHRDSNPDLYYEPLRPVHRDRNTFATPGRSKKNRLPNLEGGSLGFRQLEAKSSCFVVLTGTRSV